MKFTLFHFSCIVVAPFGLKMFFFWESVSVLFVQNVLLRGAGWGRKRSYRTAASSKKNRLYNYINEAYVYILACLILDMNFH